MRSNSAPALKCTHTHTHAHRYSHYTAAGWRLGRRWSMYEGRDMINCFNCTVPIRFTTARETSQVPQKQ